MAAKDENEKLVGGLLAKIAPMIASAFALNIPHNVLAYKRELEKNIPKTDTALWNKWCDKLVTDGFCDQDTADLLKPLNDYPFPWGGILIIMAVLKVNMGKLESMMNIFTLDRQYDALQKTTPHPAPIDNLVRSMIIDPGRSKENRAELKKHGFSDTQIDNIVLSYYKTVDEGTVRTCFMRGIISEEVMYERMRELGYTDTRIAEIVPTWKLLPGPSDLFTMVAHEAFEPEMYTKLGLDKEFPVDQVEWLEKQGISEEWAKRYWYAHWEQPSIGQGFEMLHRGVIDTETLDLLFRAVEIPSFWRDKLTKIAYMPYTRVDVRRMHDMGVIEPEDLVKAYTDLGYDLEHAGKMAEFTIKYNADTEKQLTRSAILESYREDLITKSEAKALLTAQDYSSDLADYYLLFEDYKQTKDLQDKKIDRLREQFVLNITTEVGARNSLNALGLRGSKIDDLMSDWVLDRYKYQAIPSKSELDNFLVKGIITQAHYTDLMSRHGFSPLHISWYLEDLERERTISARMPTKADLTSMYKKKAITEQEYITDMSRLGYSQKYIDLYLKIM